jgi:hypothetical protein
MKYFQLVILSKGPPNESKHPTASPLSNRISISWHIDLNDERRFQPFECAQTSSSRYVLFPDLHPFFLSVHEKWEWESVGK